MLVWQIEKMVRKYLSHPVDTKVTMEFSKTMTFPAVTFCNLNPVKQSRLTEEEKVSMEIFSATYTDDVSVYKHLLKNICRLRQAHSLSGEREHLI